ncbi:metallophosphoesterase [Gordonia neofelifaecis]|uniref:Calcineurin-like phosphoesterase n=1 Tax=Gordonia neofelifaecis NRRL B-59395 TaxID=644548 RepID=F1YH93_9ACTN|nr:metallophosphoesterase [Gordonia neofelifaecis]EGD56008.1 calcineurin-like phosphoesterase [Gordonia neofelifaecis NRRL B-59395]
MIRLLVTAVAAALVTFWLHRRLVRLPGLRGRWAVVADVVLVVLGVATVGAFAVGGTLDPAWARPIGFVGFTWAAVIFYLLLGTLLIAAARLIVRGVRRLRGGDGGAGFGRRSTAVATAVVVIASVATVGYGLAEAASPRIVNESVAIENLPAAFDGSRIALVTDLHAGPARGGGFVRDVVDAVNAQKPDLVILGGDLTDGTVALVGPDLEALRDLHAPLGVYGVSGNHEYYVDDGGSWLDFWETLGIRTLRNQRVELHRGGAVIDLAGVYDKTAPEPNAPDYQRALGGRTAGRSVVFVAHQPGQAYSAAAYAPDVQLSGHTHDGQMWPNTYLAAAANPVVAGWGDVDGVKVYVTRGTGAWGPPVRVLAPPEITMMTLHRNHSMN